MPGIACLHRILTHTRAIIIHLQLTNYTCMTFGYIKYLFRFLSLSLIHISSMRCVQNSLFLSFSACAQAQFILWHFNLWAHPQQQQDNKSDCICATESTQENQFDWLLVFHLKFFFLCELCAFTHCSFALVLISDDFRSLGFIREEKCTKRFFLSQNSTTRNSRLWMIFSN